jgi:hypothetical protein
LIAKDVADGKRTINAELIVPCRYVTYIGLGPEVKVAPGKIEHQLWVIADAPPASKAMSIDAIQATLKELSDSEGP